MSVTFGWQNDKTFLPKSEVKLAQAAMPLGRTMTG